MADGQTARWRIVLAVLLSSVLAGCGASQASVAPTASGPLPSTGASPTVQPSATRAMETEPLVVAIPSLGTQSWSPWLVYPDEEFISYLVGDTLVQSDPDTGDLLPALAESWTISDDLTTWTFKLRADVPFQDGYGTVTAEDVRFSWEQVIREDSVAGLAPLLRQAVGGDIANFKIIDPLQFSVTATEPALILATQMSNLASGLVVQSKRYWDEKGDAAAAAHPLGSGPFRFISSSSGVGVTLEALDSHPFRTTPSFRTIEVRIIGDNATRLAAVQSGDADLAQISPLQVREAKANNLRVIAVRNVGLANVIFGGFYPDHANYDRDAPWIQADAPERGLAIRKAMSAAIDRQTIIDRVFAGEGEPVACPLVCFPGAPWTDESLPLPVYDPTLAKQLLAEGGFPDGFPLEMPIFEQGGRPGTADTGEAIAGMWEAIGITVTRKPMDFATFIPLIRERATAGMSNQYVTPFYADPAIGVRTAYSTAGTNAHFNDPAIESALKRLTTVADPAERYEIIKEMSRSLVETMSAVPLFTQNSPYVAGERIGDWKPLPGLSQSRLETLTSP